MAVKFLIPNIPRLEIVKDPPWNSWGRSLFFLARPASSFTSLLMLANPFESAFFTMGVIKPLGVATAMQMSTVLNCRMLVSFHPLLTSETSRKARLDALMTKSLTESLYFSAACELRISRSLKKWLVG
jgi:hypothetical protein